MSATGWHEEMSVLVWLFMAHPVNDASTRNGKVFGLQVTDNMVY